MMTMMMTSVKAINYMQYILNIISCCGKILLFMKELLFATGLIIGSVKCKTKKVDNRISFIL